MALNISKTLYYLLRYCRLEPNLRFYYPEKQWSSLASTIFGIRSADGVTLRGKEIFSPPLLLILIAVGMSLKIIIIMFSLLRDFRKDRRTYLLKSNH